jgi:tyrosyl-tRNA synthetase
MNLYHELESREMVSQSTHPEPLRKLLKEKQGVKIYTGFDPTADSLHIGHLIPVMGLARAQRAGHHPIALIGGGTALIGDPTGKTEMRKILTVEGIDHNVSKIRQQLSKFIDFSEGKASLVNNLDWLGEKNYLEMLRDVGRHFSVNRMLTAECFKQRMEHGLSFLEFNYMILQGYDFMHLNKDLDCMVQLGGDDQWSNMLAGVDLTRRMNSREVYALTYPLLTTSDGKKMGKTEKGAVWLDPEKTSPFEYFQYWRNVPDDKVKECLFYFTFLSTEEVISLVEVEGSAINEAKIKLAYEATTILHGKDEAEKALNAAKAAFSGGGQRAEIPSTQLSHDDCEGGIPLFDLLRRAKLASSGGEARRLVKGGGVYVNGERATDPEKRYSTEDFSKELELRKGKKHIHIFSLSE